MTLRSTVGGRQTRNTLNCPNPGTLRIARDFGHAALKKAFRSISDAFSYFRKAPLPSRHLSAIVSATMVIRMRHTRAHSANRRSHHALKTPGLVACSHCGAMHRPHHMCLECGYYNGRQVMDLEAQKQKRIARMHAKKELVRSQATSEATQTPEAAEEKQ